MLPNALQLIIQSSNKWCVFILPMNIVFFSLSFLNQSTSQQTPTTYCTPQYKHKGCQTDPEPTVSVSTQFCPLMLSVGTQMYYSPSTKSTATQLSYDTLKQPVRSKGVYVIQTKIWVLFTARVRIWYYKIKIVAFIIASQTTNYLFCF